MATPSCPKCASTRFEVQELVVKNSNYRLLCVNCTSCGAVVSVNEFFNVSARLDILAKKLGVRIDG